MKYAIDARKLDEVHFGLTWLPDVARRSAAWQEWCDVVRTLEDEASEFDTTEDDVPVVLEIYSALRRLGAVFHKALAERFDALLGALLMGDAETYHILDDPDLDQNDDDGPTESGERTKPAGRLSLAPVQVVGPMSDARARRLGPRQNRRAS